MNTVCNNLHGTRVIQKLIEILTTERLIDKFIEGINPIILELINDNNGNHIIQKFVVFIKKNGFIYEFLINNYAQISSNKHGCCILQKCIEYSNPYYKVIIHIYSQQILINLIVSGTHLFIADQYANYVLQHIISLNNHEINRKITSLFINNIEVLSKQKFSSNVIEKVK